MWIFPAMRHSLWARWRERLLSNRLVPGVRRMQMFLNISRVCGRECVLLRLIPMRYSTKPKNLPKSMTAPDAALQSMLVSVPRVRTRSLPYTPAEYRERETRDAVERGLRNCGATTWMFTGLSTLRCDDFVFTVLNTTINPATIFIDIYFEDPTKNIEHIKATVPRKSVKAFSIIGDEIDSEWKYFNPASLKKRGIPENEPFAVRFMSDVPIVISSKDHKADYFSN